MIAVVVVFILVLVGWRWIASPDKDTGESVATPAIPAAVSESSPPGDPGQALRERLGWEEKRLSQLLKTLADVENNQISSLQAQAQVQELTTRLNDTRSRLKANEEARLRLEREARTFLRQNEVARREAEIELETQVQRVNDAIFDLQIQFQNAQSAGAQANSPLLVDLRTRILALERQKNQLMSRIRVQGLEAETEQIQARQDASNYGVEVRTERQNILREQADLQAALEYWQKQRRALDNPSRDERIQALRRQVDDQRQRVARLQNQIY
jgi:hypothetical protein